MLYRPSPLQLTWFGSYYASSSLGSHLRYRALSSYLLLLLLESAMPCLQRSSSLRAWWEATGREPSLPIPSGARQIAVVVLNCFWNGSLGFWIWHLHVSPTCLFTFSSPPSTALLAPVSLEALQRLLRCADPAPGWLCWLRSWVANFYRGYD